MESMEALLSKLFRASKHILPTNCKPVYDTLSICKGQEDKVGHSDRVSLVPPPPHCWVINYHQGESSACLSKGGPGYNVLDST